MTELWKMSATDIAAGVRSKRFSAREVTQSALDRLAAVNPRINAVVDSDPERSLKDADAIDARIAAGKDPGILAGVPVTIKVTHDQKGFATTLGIRALADHVATENSPIVDNLERAGAVAIGRTNMPAFGLRWFTSCLPHGATYNPFDRDLTPGGSSGGASAAVASGIGAIAHGTDIGGSIRYPAYTCGVHGLRPTLGRVANFNPSMPKRALAGQLMSVSGPLARTADDIALSLEAMSVPDARDPWWVPAPLAGPDFPRKAMLCVRPEGLEPDPAVAASLLDAADRLRDAGWEVEEGDDLPSLREAARAQVELWLGYDHADALAKAEQDGDAGAKAMLRGQIPHVEGTFEAHAQAVMLRATLLRQWLMLLEERPLVILPVSTRLPFAFDEDLKSAQHYEAVWESQIPQTGLAILGLPSMSVPTGLAGTAPVGVQLVASRYREDILVAAARDIERRGQILTPIDPTWA